MFSLHATVIVPFKQQWQQVAQLSACLHLYNLERSLQPSSSYNSYHQQQLPTLVGTVTTREMHELLRTALIYNYESLQLWFLVIGWRVFATDCEAHNCSHHSLALATVQQSEELRHCGGTIHRTLEVPRATPSFTGISNDYALVPHHFTQFLVWNSYNVPALDNYQPKCASRSDPSISPSW